MKNLKDISKHCDSYEDVFKELDELSSESDSKWVFRGVENSEYGLTPSLYRRPDIIKSWLSIAEAYPIKFEDQIRNELKLLQKYFSAANQIGLPIPGNWQYVLDHNLVEWEPTYIQSSESYSFKNILEFMAIAQHYGVPTRLLDFSFSYENALYFACKDAIDLIVDQTKIDGKRKAISDVMHGSVWAINLKYIEENKKSPIDHYVTPYRNNENIRAQKGLFVIQKHFTPIWDECRAILSTNPSQYDETKLNLFISLQSVFEDDLEKVVKKYTFSEIAKPDILDKLNSKGVNLYSLKPSLENVTKYFMINPKFDAEKKSYQKSLQIFESLRRAMMDHMKSNGTSASENDVDGLLEDGNISNDQH